MSLCSAAPLDACASIDCQDASLPHAPHPTLHHHPPSALSVTSYVLPYLTYPNFKLTSTAYARNWRLAGVERELTAVEALAELSCLMPRCAIELHLLGPAVPEDLHGGSWRCSAAERRAGSCGAPGCSCVGAAADDSGARSGNTAQSFSQAAELQTPSSDVKLLQQGSLHVRFWHGAYHELLAASGGGGSDGIRADSCRNIHDHDDDGSLPAPDLVIGLNAGLAAFPSWLPTLQLLAAGADSGTTGVGAAAAVPLVVTDFNAEAIYHAGLVWQHVVGMSNKGPVPTRRDPQETSASAPGVSLAAAASTLRPLQLLNPFRSPFPDVRHGTRLPSHSNAFALFVNCRP